MQRLKLLFVEDDADVREIVAISLGLDLSIEVETFASGPDAIEALANSGDVFHYALLDVHLPKMEGPKLHETLRDLPGMAGLQSVLITGDRQVTGGERALATGIVGVVAKPFDPLTLAKDVRALLDI